MDKINRDRISPWNLCPQISKCWCEMYFLCLRIAGLWNHENMKKSSGFCWCLYDSFVKRNGKLFSPPLWKTIEPERRTGAFFFVRLSWLKASCSYWCLIVFFLFAVVRVLPEAAFVRPFRGALPQRESVWRAQLPADGGGQLAVPTRVSWPYRYFEKVDC